MSKWTKNWMFVGFVALIIGGCSSSSSQGGSTGTAGSGGNGTGGAGGKGGAGGNGTGGFGGGSEMPCGGFAGLKCADTEFCDYPDDLCGGADGQGVCHARPQVCPDIYAPTCACDGQVYSNDCDAASKGADVANGGTCMPPKTTQFNCGHGFCDSTSQYCQTTPSDVPDVPGSFSCLDLPAACSGMTASCTCIGDPCGTPIAGMCTATGSGFTVTCPGG